MTTPKPAALLAQLSPLSLARMVWKQKIYLILLWLLASAGAVIIVSRIPSVYRAETLILVDSQKIPEKYVSPTVSTDVQDRLATISQQILSVTRLRKIIDDFDLYREQRKTMVPEEIIELMRNDIDIKLEKGWTGGRPGAFRIAYQGPIPTTVAEVANRLASLYIEENLRVREVQAEGTSEFIQNQLADAKKTLDTLEAAVTRYKLQHNRDLPQQEGALAGALDRLQVQLQGNQDASNRAQQTKILLENSLRIAEAELAALTRPPEPAAGSDDPDVRVMGVARPARPQKRSELLQAQLDLLRTRYSDDHPDVKRLREDIAKVKALEEKEKAQPVEPAQSAVSAPRPRPPVRVVSPQIAQEITRTQEQIESIKTQVMLTNRELEARVAERPRILREMADYQKRLEQLPVREQEMVALTRDYEMSKANYRSLLDKKISAEMATDMERRQKSERFTVLDPAQPPQKPFKPKRPVLITMGSCLGLALGLAVALGKEMPKNRFLGEWELPKDIPVLGRIPEMDILLLQAQETNGTGSSRGSKFRKLHWAVVSSALLSLLGAVAAGVYFAWKRF